MVKDHRSKPEKQQQQSNFEMLKKSESLRSSSFPNISRKVKIPSNKSPKGGLNTLWQSLITPIKKRLGESSNLRISRSFGVTNQAGRPGPVLAIFLERLSVPRIRARQRLKRQEQQKINKDVFSENEEALPMTALSFLPLVSQSTERRNSESKSQNFSSLSNAASTIQPETASSNVQTPQLIPSSSSASSPTSDDNTLTDVESVLLATPRSIEKYHLNGTQIKRAALSEPITAFTSAKIAGVGLVFLCGTQSGRVYLLKKSLLDILFVFDTASLNPQTINTSLNNAASRKLKSPHLCKNEINYTQSRAASVFEHPPELFAEALFLSKREAPTNSNIEKSNSSDEEDDKETELVADFAEDSLTSRFSREVLHTLGTATGDGITPALLDGRASIFLRKLRAQHLKNISTKDQDAAVAVNRFVSRITSLRRQPTIPTETLIRKATNVFSAEEPPSKTSSVCTEEVCLGSFETNLSSTNKKQQICSNTIEMENKNDTSLNFNLNLKTHEAIPQQISEQTESSSAFVHNSKNIVSSNSDHAMADLLQLLAESVGDSRVAICSLATKCSFFNFCEMILAGTFNGEIYVWEVPSGQLVLAFPCPKTEVFDANKMFVSSMATLIISEDTHCLWSGYGSGLLAVYDLSTGECKTQVYVPNKRPVVTIEIAPQSALAIVLSGDTTVSVWSCNSSTPSLLKTFSDVQLTAGIPICCLKAVEPPRRTFSDSYSVTLFSGCVDGSLNVHKLVWNDTQHEGSTIPVSQGRLKTLSSTTDFVDDIFSVPINFIEKTVASSSVKPRLTCTLLQQFVLAEPKCPISSLCVDIVVDAIFVGYASGVVATLTPVHHLVSSVQNTCEHIQSSICSTTENPILS